MTKPASHTPEDWRSKDRRNPVVISLSSVHCERLGFCISFVNGHRMEEAEANAKLIAASPSLKALIEMIYDGLHCGVGPMATAGDAEVAEIINDTMCDLLGNEWRTGHQ